VDDVGESVEAVRQVGDRTVKLEAILKELRDERERLDRALLAFECLAATRKKRRGRPPKWMKRLDGRDPVIPSSRSNEGAPA
jgi:hypothetical protein